MGYPLQAGAPQITVEGRTFALGSFRVDAMVSMHMVGVFEQISGGWNQVGQIAFSIDPASLVQKIKDEGGIVAFLKWLVAKINAILAALFGKPVVPPTGEPATYAEAAAQITAHINGLQLTLVDGVLVAA